MTSLEEVSPYFKNVFEEKQNNKKKKENKSYK